MRPWESVPPRGGGGFRLGNGRPDRDRRSRHEREHRQSGAIRFGVMRRTDAILRRHAPCRAVHAARPRCRRSLHRLRSVRGARPCADARGHARSPWFASRSPGTRRRTRPVQQSNSLAYIGSIAHRLLHAGRENGPYTFSRRTRPTRDLLMPQGVRDDLREVVQLRRVGEHARAAGKIARLLREARALATRRSHAGRFSFHYSARRPCQSARHLFKMAPCSPDNSVLSRASGAGETCYYIPG